LKTETFRRALARIREWKRDPIQQVREEFGVEPDDFQAEALRAFASEEHRRIAMKACKGPGKTAVLAWMIWNFLSCYAARGSHPKGAATSITEDNINDNLWPELSKWQQRSAFLTEAFTWTKTRIHAKDHPETWFFSKRTWSKSADQQQQADTLAGIHGDFVLFVLDESGGQPASLMATAEAALQAPWAKIVQAGNPTHLSGPLYDAVTRHRDYWYVIEITGDPDDPRRAKRIPEQWARDQIQMYGRDNPWVLVNVFGRFPPSSINALLGPDDISAAQRRYSELDRDKFEWAQKRFGVDVARFGDDRTVIFPRQGLMTHRPIILRGARTTVIAARIMLAEKRWGGRVLTLMDDTGGWAHGAVDNLIAAGRSPIAVQYGGSAIDPRFANKRSEMHFLKAEWVKRGGALPPDVEGMVEEMTVSTYTFLNGKFIVEDKKLVKDRLLRSPDIDDALATSFGIPDLPGDDENLPPALQQRRGLKAEYDPFAEMSVA
jgi:phage terminase large subunit